MFGVADARFKYEDILNTVHNLDKTPLEGSRDVFMHEESPSLGFDDSVILNPLDHSYVSPMCSLLSPSPKYYIDMPVENPMIVDANVDLGYEVNMFDMLGGNINNFVSLDCFSGFNASFDPYYIYLEDLPRKITWTTLFNHSYDFSMAIDKVKRIPILFAVVSLLPLTFYFLNCGPRSLISSCIRTVFVFMSLVLTL